MFYSPTADEVAWARGFAGSDEHLLAMVVLLKCFGRLGYFPPLQTVPAVVIEHVRRDLGLPEDVVAVHAAPRTAKRHRDFVRQRFGVVRNSAAARKVAAEAIREAAHARNQPPDLINIALERLVEGCFELPAFSTLDKMASRIRGEVNGEIFAGITGRAGPSGVGSLQALLEPKGPRGKTDLDRLKRSAPRPTWTNFRKQLDQRRCWKSRSAAPIVVLPASVAAGLRSWVVIMTVGVRSWAGIMTVGVRSWVVIMAVNLPWSTGRLVACRRARRRVVLPGILLLRVAAASPARLSGR